MFGWVVQLSTVCMRLFWLRYLFVIVKFHATRDDSILLGVCNERILAITTQYSLSVLNPLYVLIYGKPRGFRYTITSSVNGLKEPNKRAFKRVGPEYIKTRETEKWL